MRIFNFVGTFDLLTITEKLLWSTAVVSTVLIVILFTMSFFGAEFEKEAQKQQRFAWVDARVILLFFTFFGWSSILAHLWEDSIATVLLYGFPIGVLAALAPSLLSLLKKNSPNPILLSGFQLEEAITSTGEVLQYIPPHINGKGKVHLSLRNAPYQINAVTRNGEIAPGVPVRVVAILDKQTLVVEPLDGNPPDLPVSP